MRDKKLFQLAEAFGAEYIYIDTLSGMSGLFNRKLWSFKIEALKRIGRLYTVRKLIKHIYKMSSSSSEAIASMYDVEYGGLDRPNYMYLNTLLFRQEFEKITGITADEMKNLKIIDVGAGSNELLRFLHTEFGIKHNQLFGSDLSPASVKIIIEDGFHGYTGRIEQLHFPENNFDLVFLSYFIDFDTDQRKTLEEVVKITQPGGKIILEGKFPSNPSGLSDADKGQINFITKGVEVVEDIELVCRAIEQIAQFQNKRISVERVIRSKRYVFSRYGLCKLPSYFLVFRIGNLPHGQDSD
ncbi:MAG: class I SAM-dependent methyltransferase [bacterium]|nr:class I SAM-dependent methyltransferase [bacterium]